MTSTLHVAMYEHTDGGHTRVRVFAGFNAQRGCRGKCGDLTFRTEEWAKLRPILRAVRGDEVTITIETDTP